MIFQLSVAARNAMLDAFETAVGENAILKIRTLGVPANCAAPETTSSVVLATCQLPQNWMDNAASGAKSKAGVWQDTSADAAGTAGYWRIYDSTGTTCHAQGDITGTGGNGSMTVDNVVFAQGQAFTVTGFTLSQGNG